jgi:outer membrane protein TolC
MIRHRRCLVAVLFASLPICAAGAADEILTLEQAQTEALTNNTTVENAGISIEETADQIAATKTRRYPSLQLRVGELHNMVPESFEFEQGALGTVAGEPVPPRTTEIESQDGLTTHISVEAKQPIVGLYKIGLDLDRLGVREKMARQDLRAKRQEIAQRVKEQYYEILETQSAMEATQESIDFYQSLVKVVTDKVKQKTALSYDLLNAQANLAKAEYDGLKQRNTLLSEKERLNELMGRSIAIPFSVTAQLPPDATTPDMEAAQAQALQQRPDAQEARLKLRHAQYDLDLKRAEYLPDVDLTASYNRSIATEFVPDESFYVGVVARWEFFDWGRRGDEITKARRSVNQAHNDIRQVDAKVSAEVNARIRDLQNAQELVGVATKAQDAARQKLKVTRDRYVQQATLLDDVLKAQSELEDANNDYHQAVLQVWTARANLAKALGEE